MLKIGIVLTAVAALLAAPTSAPAAFWLYATDFHSKATLDENVSQTNAIDREAAGNTKSLAVFKLDVAAAFAADVGGVCTWGDAEGYRDDKGTKQAGLGTGASGRGYNYFDSHGSAVGGEKTKLLYGTSQTKALQMVPRRCLEVWSGGYPGTYTAVSGPSNVAGTPNPSGAVVTPETNYWNGDPDSDNTRETLTFTPLASGETVKELGLVLLSTSSVQNVQVWVDYADSTSSAVRTISIGAGTTNDDVFVYFDAPTAAISALHWDSDISRPPIGDLAVIMTPEPATLSLLALAGLGLLRRRVR